MTSALVVVALVLATALAARAAVAAAGRSVPARHALALADPHPAPLRAAPALEPPAWFLRRLEATGVGVAPGTAWTAWAGLVVAASLAGLVAGGGGAAVLALGTAIAAPLGALSAAGGRADRRLEAALPDVLEAVARGLRSGASLRGALAEAGAGAQGPLGVDLRRLSADVDHGEPLPAAIDDWVRRRPLVGVRLSAAAVLLASEAGGAPARAVDGVAATLRSRLDVAAEVRALASQARISALVMVAAPLAFAAFSTATDRKTRAFLLGTPVGLACLVIGIGLDAVAAVWMQHLSRVEA